MKEGVDHEVYDAQNNEKTNKKKKAKIFIF